MLRTRLYFVPSYRSFGVKTATTIANDGALADCIRETLQGFAAAARRESEIAHQGLSMPAYFLAARAIELGLKSFLLLRGSTEQDLRRISHDLGKALDAARQEGLDSITPVSTEAEQAVRWINEYYYRKDLEYPTAGYKSYPQIHYLVTFADLLFTSLQPQRRRWRASP